MARWRGRHMRTSPRQRPSSLQREGSFDGPTPPLTAAEALDLADLAAIASEVLGRPIARQTIADAALMARLAARGLPPHAANIALGLYVASRNGEFSAIDPTLERLPKRRPMAMREPLPAMLPAKRPEANVVPARPFARRWPGSAFCVGRGVLRGCIEAPRMGALNCLNCCCWSPG